MYEALANSTKLISWGLSVFGGIGLIYSYLDFRKREQRLPLATTHDDIETRLKILQKEHEALTDEIQDLHKSKADRDFYVAETDRLKSYIEQEKGELLKILADREMQEILRAEIKRLEAESADLHKIVSEKRTELDSAERRREDHETALQNLENRSEELQKSIADHEKAFGQKTLEIDQLNTTLHLLRDEESLIEEKLARSKKEIEELNVELERKKELEHEKIRLEASNDSLRNSIEHLNEEKNRLDTLKEELLQDILEAEATKLDTTSCIKKLVKEREELAQELPLIRKQKESLEAERNVLKEECDRYSPLLKEYKDKALKEQQDKLENTKSLEDLSKPCFAQSFPPSPKIEEKEAFTNLKRFLKERNLHYPDRLLYSFHTSLKINDASPLVVLSGISGTGKSQLPVAYAQAMGINFLNIAVQPRWDSPQDIFGFYNYLEGRYKATELTRVLIQAERYNRKDWDGIHFEKNYPIISDQMTLVLFDEMNLARVEYYFSEFLSKMEARRDIDRADESERRKAEIVLDIGRLQKSGKDMSLFVDKNILLVGTMNEDETTQSLSDKILDRANVLRFGRPKKLISDKSSTAPASNPCRLTYDNWNKWIEEAENKDKKQGDYKDIDAHINELNESMEKMGRPFGHRMSQAILSYVVNYPKFSGENCIRDAFADQIEQRILPKLRNINSKEYREPLETVKKLIDWTNDNKLKDAFEASLEKDFFEWNGVPRE